MAGSTTPSCFAHALMVVLVIHLWCLGQQSLAMRQGSVPYTLPLCTSPYHMLMKADPLIHCIYAYGQAIIGQVLMVLSHHMWCWVLPFYRVESR